MFRSIFFFCFKNKKVFEDDPNLSNSQNEDNQDENGEWHQKVNSLFLFQLFPSI